MEEETPGGELETPDSPKVKKNTSQISLTQVV